MSTDHTKHAFGISDFRETEEIIAVVRHHWFVFFRDVIGLLVLFFIPFFFLPFLSTFVTAGGGPVGIPSGYGFFFAAMWGLVIWHLLFARWTDYYFDIWVVTSQRIVDIDQKGFFRRNVATMVNYDRVEDVQFELTGVIGNLLNFGHVQVQTAAANREFIMEEVANPQKLERLIHQAVSDDETRRHSASG